MIHKSDSNPVFNCISTKHFFQAGTLVTECVYNGGKVEIFSSYNQDDGYINRRLENVSGVNFLNQTVRSLHASKHSDAGSRKP